MTPKTPKTDEPPAAHVPIAPPPRRRGGAEWADRVADFLDPMLDGAQLDNSDAEAAVAVLRYLAFHSAAIQAGDVLALSGLKRRLRIAGGGA